MAHKGSHFRPRPSYHEPQAMKPGAVLTPRRDVEEEREKVITVNPVLTGYVKRYAGVAPAQRRLTNEAYTAGWHDCFQFVSTALKLRANVVPAKGPLY